MPSCVVRRYALRSENEPLSELRATNAKNAMKRERNLDEKEKIRNYQRSKCENTLQALHFLCAKMIASIERPALGTGYEK